MFLRCNGSKEVYEAIQYNKFSNIKEFDDLIKKYKYSYEESYINGKKELIIGDAHTKRFFRLELGEYLLISDIYGIGVYTEKEIKSGFERISNTDLFYYQLLDEFKDRQMFKVNEELGELIRAISRMVLFPSKANEDNLVEELGDVENVIREVKLYFGIPQSAVERQKQAKNERTKFWFQEYLKGKNCNGIQ